LSFILVHQEAVSVQLLVYSRSSPSMRSLKARCKLIL